MGSLAEGSLAEGALDEGALDRSDLISKIDKKDQRIGA